jgi:flagellar biosynthesis/type III secretory pathway M-ring protein FliF/YscJ
MGIVVPQGSHTVTFTYAPTSFFISKYIVLVLSSLVVGAIIVLVILRITKKGKPDEEQEEQEKTDTSADTSSNA